MPRFLTALLVTALQLPAHDPISTGLTWTQEISRIVQFRCSGCHRKGGSAPMPLASYAEARPWAKAIRDEVLQRRMPPWGAVKGFGEFRGDPSLSQDEIQRIAEWVEGGAPEGNPIYFRYSDVRRSSQKPTPAGRWVKQWNGPTTLLAVRPTRSLENSQVIARLPDDSAIPLLWLRDYKQGFRRTFIYREPIRLPHGTALSYEPRDAFEFLITRAR